MKTLLIQTISGRVVHDFAFDIINRIHSDERVEQDFQYRLHHELIREEPFSEYIPVGSVEFVTDWLLGFHQIDYKPINIPKCLQQEEFLGRRYMDDYKGFQLEFADESKWFVKERDRLKGVTGCMAHIDKRDIQRDTDYIVSDVVDIISEWRVFVHRGKILDMKCYSGDFWVAPNKQKVMKIVESYKDAPIAYTLDVARLNTGTSHTVIIELHDYFSCGLYGFDSPKHPYMMSQAWFEMLRKNKLK